MTGEPTIQQLFDLTEKVAVVTGGAGWLGSAMCRALAEAGARVVVTSRSVERAEEFAAALPGDTHHLGVKLDLNKADDVESCVPKILKVTGKIDILVNNGIQLTAGTIDTLEPEDWAQSLLTGVTGPFFLSRVVYNHLKERDAPGSIINIASMYGVVGSYPHVYDEIDFLSPANYHATKGGLVHLTRHLAVYWAEDNVRVNAISPGPFPKPAVQESKEFMRRLNEKTPLGRVGANWELKGAVLFLASDASSFMTGHNLVVDGGWTAW